MEDAREWPSPIFDWAMASGLYGRDAVTATRGRAPEGEWFWVMRIGSECYMLSIEDDGSVSVLGRGEVLIYRGADEPLGKA